MVVRVRRCLFVALSRSSCVCLKLPLGPAATTAVDVGAGDGACLTCIRVEGGHACVSARVCECV
eukprot:1080969-Rhodomonas_salina.3